MLSFCRGGLLVWLVLQVLDQPFWWLLVSRPLLQSSSREWAVCLVGLTGLHGWLRLQTLRHGSTEGFGRVRGMEPEYF